MNSDPETMHCAEFQARLADLIAAGEDLSSHPHLRNCERCQALVADLETIAAAARSLFPSVEPPDEVWENIESALKKDENRD